MGVNNTFLFSKGIRNFECNICGKVCTTHHSLLLSTIIHRVSQKNGIETTTLSEFMGYKRTEFPRTKNCFGPIFKKLSAAPFYLL